MKKSLVIVSLIIFIIFSRVNAVSARSFEILNPRVEQGGTVIVKVLAQSQELGLCISVFGVSPFMREFSINKKGYSFIGIDVKTKPGQYWVYLVGCLRGLKHDEYEGKIEVVEKDFGNPWYAGPVKVPGTAVQERRAKDVALIQAAYNSANEYDNYTSGPFILPLDSIEVTDYFGTVRFYGPYDRKKKQITIEKEVPHGGVDLRAKKPTPIMAINSGKVILAHLFPLKGTEGNMLMIDHGSGIISLYLHLSKFKVKAGDQVFAGQVVALSGATPSGTPPHLHLMIKVHGTNVDPLAFIDTMNSFF